MFFDALLGMKANSICWTFTAQLQGMNGVYQIVVSLA